MIRKFHYIFRAALNCLILSLTACGTTGQSASSTTGNAAPTLSTGTTASTAIEAALPLIRTGAAVATGAVLDFSVQQSSTRTRLANEMYAAANAVYSLSGGTFPAPAQFESSIVAFGGSQTDASYAQFSTAIAALYAAYYPKLATGDTKTAADLLNAIAGGIEDATAAYVTTPVAVAVTGIDLVMVPLPGYGRSAPFRWYRPQRAQPPARVIQSLRDCEADQFEFSLWSPAVMGAPIAAGATLSF